MSCYLYLAVLGFCVSGIGSPVLGIVGDFQQTAITLVQPMQAHLLDVCHGAEVDISPIVLLCFPHAGEALCWEYAAHGLTLALEGNLLDGPIEGIVLAEGEVDGVEGALALEIEGLLQFACHSGGLLGLLVGVVDNLSSAWTARQCVALEHVGV